MWGKLSPRCIIYLASKMLYELETHYLFMKLHPLLFFFALFSYSFALLFSASSIYRKKEKNEHLVISKILMDVETMIVSK
jgi:hypothetical protein